MSEEYQFTTEAIDKYYSGTDQWKVISNNSFTPEDAETVLGQVPNVDVVKSANGKVLSYNFKASENVASSAAEAVNSNIPPNVKSFDVPANTALDDAGKMTFTSGMSQAGNFVFTKVVPAIAAAGAGITLGKTFDKVLYSANPNFWDEHGMSTLDPDTWGDIIGTDTAGGRFLNMILGTTPDGKTQAYLDQNALAYMALYMQNKGVFTTEQKINNIGNLTLHTPDILSMPITFLNGGELINTENNQSTYITPLNNCKMIAVKVSYNNIIGYSFLFASNESTAKYKITSGTSTWENPLSKYSDGKYRDTFGGFSYIFNGVYSTCKDGIIPWQGENNIKDILKIMLDGTVTESGIDGTGTQENAKTPDLSNATTVQEALDALKEQYPDLFEKAVTQDVVQPDGSTVTYTYVPIAVPELDPEGNPISSPDLDPEGNPIGSTQANPQIDPATAPEPLLKLITTLIQKDPPINQIGRAHV